MKQVLTLTAVAGLLIPFTSHAAPADGVPYLLSRQNLDGSFGSIPLRDTTATLRALELFDSADTATLDQASAYVWYAHPISMDFTARRVRLLSELDLDTSDDEAVLLTTMNTTYSWGPYSGWPGTTMDTTLVLSALSDSASVSVTQASYVLGFLMSRQASDGGFAWEDNDTSDPLLTVEVLEAFKAWQDVFSLSTPIADMVDYLFGLQQSNGLLGTTLPVLTTAAVLSATYEDVSVDGTQWGLAYSALAASQRANGSFEDDVYTTALSMIALGSVRPDLNVLSVATSATPVVDGEANGVVVQLKNEGRVALTQTVPIEAVFVSSSTGVETRLGSVNLSSLGSGSTTTVTVPWTTDGFTGAGYLEVTADPNNTLKESDRSDNFKSVAVTVLGGPDAAVLLDDFVLEPENPSPQDTLQVEALVRSFAGVTMSNVVVELHDGNPAQGGTRLTQSTLTLDPGEAEVVTWSGKLANGNHTLYLTVDRANTIDEVDETNNQLTKAVKVETTYDFVVDQMTVLPLNPAPEETVDFYAMVHNESNVALSNLVVDLYDGNPTQGGTRLQQYSLNLAVGASSEIAWSGNLAVGTHTLYAIADRTNAFSETDETNNTASMVIPVAKKIDLQVNAGQVLASPINATVESDVTLSVNVYNAGKSASGPFAVTAYLFDPSTMGSSSDRVVVDTETVSDLAPGATSLLSLTVPTDQHLGAITLTGAADVARAVTETDEGNNEASVTINVVKKPNLTLTSSDFTPPDPIQEGKTTQLSATVHNNGGGTAYNVAVQFFLGTSPGTLIGTSTIQQLEPGASAATPALNWNTTAIPTGSQTLVAKVDPNGIITESDETDNQASKVVTVQPRPDLAFQTALAASPAVPEQGDMVTFTATVANLTSMATSSGFTAKLYDGNPSSGGRLVTTQTFGVLAGNATAALSMTWNTEGWAGRHTFYALLDPDSAVNEGNESNNQSSLALNVGSGDASLEPVTNLVATTTGDNVSLTWSNTLSPMGYRIYRDGQIRNPPDLTYDLLTDATVSASSETTGHGASSAKDGSTSTFWEGDPLEENWTYEIDLGVEQEVAAFKVWWTVQGNLQLTFAFQTYTDGEWHTRLENKISAAGTGVGTSSFTLPKTISSDLVRLFMTRTTAEADEAAIAEIEVYGPALVATKSFTDINVDAAIHQYEIRSSSGTGREGEPAELSVTLGDVAPPTSAYAVAYSSYSEVGWTASPSSTLKGYEVLRDNVALLSYKTMSGLSATASSSTSGHEALYGVDSATTSTYWQSSGSGPWTYDITLPSSKRIYSVQLYFTAAYYPKDYEIQGWTGSSWLLEESVLDNGASSRMHLFTQFGATNKIRINMTRASSTAVAISHVVVYEAVPTTATAITDSYRPDYSISYVVAAMSDTHVAFASTEPTVPPSGQEPPLPPSSPSVTAYTRSDITLGWTAVTNPILAGYNVYTSSGTKLNSSLVTANSFTHAGVIDPAVTSYGYAISSVNTYGYESPKRSSVTWTPPLPAAPTLSQLTSGTTVALSWSNASEVLRDGFKVYKDGSAYSTTTAASFTDYDVASGTHNYQVSGYDLFGREGTKSSAVTTTITRTDLEIAQADLSLMPELATVLDTGTLTAVVHNVGDVASSSSQVKFYDGDPSSGGVLIGTASLPAISGNSSTAVSLKWSLANEGGDHEIFAVADPSNTVREISETNNKAFIEATIYPEPSYQVALGAIDTSAFPTLSAPLSIEDSFGDPVSGLTARFVSLVETSGAGTSLTLLEGSTPGTYTLGWKTPNTARDSSTRQVTVTVQNPPSEGMATGSYRAPDPLYDVALTAFTANPGAPAADTSVTLSATVKNNGTSSLSSVKVRFYANEVSSGTGVGETSISSLSSGSSATVTKSVTVKAGTTTYYAVVDPDNAWQETSESNNQASLTLNVPENTTDLIAESSGIAFSPTAPYSGDVVTISATVRNTGAAASSVMVQASLGDPSAGGTVLGTQTLAELASSSPQTVSFSWNTSGLSGSQSIYIWVDPRSRVIESNEGNNIASKAITLTKHPVTLALSTDKTTYQAQSSIGISATVDPKGQSFSGQLQLSLLDGSGNVVETLSPLTVGPTSSAQTLTASSNSSTYTAGSYQILGVLMEGVGERTRGTTSFAIAASASLLTSVRSDRGSYAPYDSVVIQGSITNTSVNTALSSVTGTLSLLSPSGTTVTSSQVGPSSLDKNQALAVNAVWPLADNAPGTYTYRLVGTSGSTTHTSSSTFTISSTQDNGVGLRGALTLSVANTTPGGDVFASYEIKNEGNANVSGLASRVILVSDTDGTAESTHPFTLTVAKGNKQTGSFALDTNAAEGAYSVLLQVDVGGSTQTLALDALNILNLLGELVLSSNTLEGGEGSLVLMPSLTNLSSQPVADLSLRLDVVSKETAETVETFPRSTSLGGGETDAWEEELSTDSLEVGDYQALLVIELAGGDVILAEDDFVVVDTRSPISSLRFTGTAIAKDGITYLKETTYLVLEATDNFAGVQAIKYRLDGTSEQTYLAPFTVSSEGAHTLTYAAVDLHGNQEATQTASLVVDVKAPTIAVTGVPDCSASSVTPVVTVTDVSPTVVVMKLDGAAYDGSAVTWVGDHVLDITATDLVGRVSTSRVTFKVAIDRCDCPNQSDCGTPVPDVDADGDGVPSRYDCNDNDPQSFPGALEVCDGKDNNCNGKVDELSECATPEPTSTPAPDRDDDGYADGSDCAPDDASINPGELEVCGDSKDNDCDGGVDELEECAPTPPPVTPTLELETPTVAPTDVPATPTPGSSETPSPVEESSIPEPAVIPGCQCSSGAGSVPSVWPVVLFGGALLVIRRRRSLSK